MSICSALASESRTWSQLARFLQASDSAFQQCRNDQVVIRQFAKQDRQPEFIILSRTARLTCRRLSPPLRLAQASPPTWLLAVSSSLQVKRIMS